MTQSTPPGYPAAAPLSQGDERMWATLIHVGGIITGFIAPLIGYLVLKDRSAFVRDNARNALNFQITVVIGYVVSAILTFVVIGVFTYLIVAVLSIVFGVLAAIAANRGETYRYPLSIAFVK